MTSCPMSYQCPCILLTLMQSPTTLYTGTAVRINTNLSNNRSSFPIRCCITTAFKQLDTACLALTHVRCCLYSLSLTFTRTHIHRCLCSLSPLLSLIFTIVCVQVDLRFMLIYILICHLQFGQFGY